MREFPNLRLYRLIRVFFFSSLGFHSGARQVWLALNALTSCLRGSYYLIDLWIIGVFHVFDHLISRVNFLTTHFALGWMLRIERKVLQFRRECTIVQESLHYEFRISSILLGLEVVVSCDWGHRNVFTSAWLLLSIATGVRTDLRIRLYLLFHGHLYSFLSLWAAHCCRDFILIWRGTAIWVLSINVLSCDRYHFVNVRGTSHMTSKVIIALCGREITQSVWKIVLLITIWPWVCVLLRCLQSCWIINMEWWIFFCSPCPWNFQIWANVLTLLSVYVLVLRASIFNTQSERGPQAWPDIVSNSIKLVWWGMARIWD